MGKQYLRAFVDEKQRKRIAEAQAGTPIRFIASTEGVKRDGLDLQVDRWDFENYKRNPIVTWVHDLFGHRLPIGRGDTSIDLEKRVMLADVSFDQEDEFARSIESKYRRGYLHSISVSWDDIETDDGMRYDLLDIAAVPLPGDPEALVERQFRALRAILEGAEGTEVTEEPEGPEGAEETKVPEEPEGAEEDELWKRTAEEMVGLFSRGCELGEEERKAEYHRLCAAYRKLEKTPPELLPLSTVRALGEGEVAGLFLEGEVPPPAPPSGKPIGERLGRGQVQKLMGLLDEMKEVLAEPEGGSDGSELGDEANPSTSSGQAPPDPPNDGGEQLEVLAEETLSLLEEMEVSDGETT